MMITPTESRSRVGAPFWSVDHGDARRQGDARCRSVPTLPLAPEFQPWLMLNWPTRVSGHDRPVRGTSSPITGDSRSVWSGVRARGCGMRRGHRSSTSSPGGAATCWAIARRGLSKRFSSRWPSSSMCPIRGIRKLRDGGLKLLSERYIMGSAAKRSSATRAGSQRSGDQAGPAPWPCAWTDTRSSRFGGGFHGRTYGATSATAQPKYHEGIGPLLGGFRVRAVRRLGRCEQTVLTTRRARILIEPIQGEGGIRIPPEVLTRPAGIGRRARALLILRRSPKRLRPNRASGSPISTFGVAGPIS